MLLYTLYDAVVKPMPGRILAPSLAGSFTASEDGLTYDFVLRNGAKFHNGDPVTADDVKFSFDRYRGSAHDVMKGRVTKVEVADDRHIRFSLKEPWPDLLTFYSSTSGADIKKVGDEGFKQAPIGAGPCKFVSFTPRLELALKAFNDYWRKPPNVNRLVMKMIPHESTSSPVYDSDKAKKLMAETEFAGGFDAGLLHCDSFYANMAEVSVNNLQATGIQTKLMPIDAPVFSPVTPARNISVASFRGRARPLAMPPRAWSRSSLRAEPSPIAAILTSMPCIHSRPTRSIAKSGPLS